MIPKFNDALFYSDACGEDELQTGVR